ncbi:UNVERIFIED_CONTAM: hypothetical protein LK11_43195 [Mumia flava]
MAVGRELVLLALLYAGYSLTRLLADDDLGSARARADAILGMESWAGVDVEVWTVDLVIAHPAAAVAASFWYATTHYVVTAAVVGWLLLCRPDAYVRLRRTLVLATVAALGCYLLLPTAPPRLTGGYHDVLATTSGVGWWGTDASAPEAFAGSTNELAAFPSMHAGWALWVALVALEVTTSRAVRVAALLYALITAVVVVATANHWVLDVVVGLVLVLLARSVVVHLDHRTAGSSARGRREARAR